MKKLIVVIALSLAAAGCSIKAEMSVMKQWDRPAEKTITEDVMRPSQPKTRIETQENLRIETSPAAPEVQEPAAPVKKPISFEVPPVIVPQTKGVQYMYLHVHGDEKRTCYVRKVPGLYALNTR